MSRSLFALSIGRLMGHSDSHGDLLFLTYKSQAAEAEAPGPAPVPTSAPTQAPQPITARRQVEPWETVVEDPVDTYWREKDGKIQRQRDSNFCRHGSNAMCDYCMPLEASSFPFIIHYT